jgi:geranylgeranyl reductase family protein
VDRPAWLFWPIVASRVYWRSRAVRADVLVVGAGPAGSTAARECARRGLSVRVLDRAIFPRDKPCGGGVNVRAARLLPFALTPVAERVASSIRISIRRSAGFTVHSAEPLTYLTQRAQLDAFLAARAIEAGAALHEGMQVHAVERHADRVVVRAGTAHFEGRALIVADGANSRVAALAGFMRARWTLYALEGNITPPDGVPAAWGDVLGVDVGDTPGGYGWLFPKQDHLNIGVLGWAAIGPTLRSRLDQLARFYGFDPSAIWGLRGHPLPIRQPGMPVVDGNIALVGDAAGMVDPLSGEGIYAAIASGSLAAACLAEYLDGQAPDLRRYQREVDRTILTEQSVARQFYDILHTFPEPFLQLTRRLPWFWPGVCKLVRGEQTYIGLKRSLGPGALGVDLAARILRPRSGLLAPSRSKGLRQSKR